MSIVIPPIVEVPVCKFKDGLWESIPSFRHLDENVHQVTIARQRSQDNSLEQPEVVNLRAVADQDVCKAFCAYCIAGMQAQLAGDNSFPCNLVADYDDPIYLQDPI